MKHLRGLDLGDGGIPTLEEALQALVPVLPINLELKFNKPKYRRLVEVTAEVIEGVGYQHRVLVSSFYHQSLSIMRKTLPEVMTAPLFGTNTGPPHPDDLEEIFGRELYPQTELPFQGRVAVIDHNMANRELVEQFHAHQGALLVYTVDKPEHLARMVQVGVDGIITNRPALAHRILETLAE